MANEYTPTVWRTGDVITAEKLNKIEEGIANAGQPSWETVFEGSVTTVTTEGESNSEGVITDILGLTSNPIKVTFNGIDYILNKGDDGAGHSWYGAPFDDDTGTIDFSEYPFAIYSDETVTLLLTETAGTYTLKIEEPESGGSSDFSTVEVTIINNTESIHFLDFINLPDYDETQVASNITVGSSSTVNALAVLYKNNPTDGHLQNPEGYQLAFSGDIADDGDGYFIISGAGTITITITNA